VVACAVILPPEHGLVGLKDSKQLSAGAREDLAPRIRSRALAWGLGLTWPERIDSVNILQATFEAMSRAVRSLPLSPEVLRIDGNKILPEGILRPHWQAAHSAPPPRQIAIVGGDRTQAAISAASILAKTFRDKLMRALARRWPGYGFETHKGYGTREHYEALLLLGPCPQHRLTFRGVRPGLRREGSLWDKEKTLPEHILSGMAGEDAAAELLRKKGMQILDRNWRKGRLELDIVCLDGDTLVFVEVKTRNAQGMSEPADALTPAKRRVLVRAAQAWLGAHNAWRRPCRFDVVCVLKNDFDFSAEHYSDAFDFSPTLGGSHTAWQPW
jgi:ribonuclease HII